MCLERAKVGTLKRLLHGIRCFLQLVTDLLYPPRCPVCERVMPAAWSLRGESPWYSLVCEKCAGELPWIREPVCKKCGKPLIDDTAEYCSQCSVKLPPYLEGRCVFLYHDSFRASVVRMKFHDHREYLDFYAAAMHAFAFSFLERICGGRGKRNGVLVPVPLSKRKRRERGFDQCALLAKKLSLRTGIPFSQNALIRIRDTKPQKGLGLYERKMNLRGAVAAGDLSEVTEPVILIDDIFTTGSTIEECCRALQKEGITQIYFLVLCTAVRPE